MVLNTGWLCHLRGKWQCLETFLVIRAGRGWLLLLSSTERPERLLNATVHRTAHRAKNDLTQNVSNAKDEKPWSSSHAHDNSLHFLSPQTMLEAVSVLDIIQPSPKCHENGVSIISSLHIQKLTHKNVMYTKSHGFGVVVEPGFHKC